MKKIIKYLGIFICVITLFTFFNKNLKVEAEGTYNSSLSASSSKVKPGDTFNVTLSLSGLPSEGLGAATYYIKYDSSLLEYTSNSNSKYTATNEGTQIKLVFIDVGKLTGNPSPLREGTTLTFKAKTEGTAQFVLTSTGTSVADTGANITSNNSGTSVTIKSPSTINHLENLYLTESGATIVGFDKDKLNYEIATDNNYIKLTAVYAETAIVSGGGWSCNSSTRICTITRNNLNYGNNQIVIILKSETNSSKTYTITVKRNDNRDSDSRLSSIEGVSNFNKDVYKYDIDIPTTQGTFVINAQPAKKSSTVTYSTGNNIITLNYGETRSVVITVKAENGNVSTYTLNVTRKDNRSTNNYLKTLTVDKGSISFDKENYSYRIVLDNDVDSITIGATAEDSKSRIEGIGTKPLAVGSNLFRITVIAENESKKIYTISVIRKDKNNDASKLSRNTNVKSLTLNGEKVNLIPNIFTYALSVENDVAFADFFCDLEDTKAMALLEGDRNLKVGVNKFKITVTAENGNNVVYEIVVERKELRTVISNTKEDILNTINNSTDSVITVSIPYNDTNRSVDAEILNALKTTNKTLIYEILNENRGLNYSVTLVGSNLTDITDFNFSLLFKSDNKDAIDALSNAKKTVYIDLKENTGLKGKIPMKVYVGDKFDATNTLTLYYYDKTNNKLEKVVDKLRVKNSYVEIEVDKLAEYILVDESQTPKKSTTSSSGSSNAGIFIIIGVVAVIAIIVIIIIISNDKKKKRIIKPIISTSTNNTTNTTSNIQTNNSTIENTAVTNDVVVEPKEESVNNINTNNLIDPSTENDQINNNSEN